MSLIRVMAAIDTYRVGGPGKGLLQFCQEAQRYAIDPHLVTFIRGHRMSTEFMLAARGRQVSIEVIRERVKFDPTVLSRLAELARQEGIQVLQTHGHKANVSGMLLRHFLGIPWVAFAHGWTDEDWKVRAYNKLDLIAMRRADRVATVSNQWKAKLAGLGVAAKKIRVIPNAIALPQSVNGEGKKLREELHVAGATPLIGVVGRLSPEKGHRYFLEAFKRTTELVPDASAVFVGDGQEEAHLKEQTHALGLDSRVIFAGYRTDVSRFYQALDVLVLPSLTENMPNVALEAMAYGKPVVGTRVGGIPEVVVDGETGLLVKPADAESLGRALSALLRDRARLPVMGENGRRFVAGHYSVASRMEKFVALYREVLTG
ncbi:MAG: glycosyltransferase family 4 protein [Planctomycetes bacterium]|nr:glycosyltransferase family 4 protein [Planctomycetota bacterium]MBM4078612.1 glycosyltransferase family 4 protein [Planctomycetota bacterium]MBM4085350.1 glycosyltransferase family 4 protein [Planctomycetota bacterium]